MTIDAIIMAILSYGFFVGGFVLGLIKVVKSDQNQFCINWLKKPNYLKVVFRLLMKVSSRNIKY